MLATCCGGVPTARVLPDHNDPPKRHSNLELFDRLSSQFLKTLFRRLAVAEIQQDPAQCLPDRLHDVDTIGIVAIRLQRLFV